MRKAIFVVLLVAAVIGIGTNFGLAESQQPSKEGQVVIFADYYGTIVVPEEIFVDYYGTVEVPK
jgi:hypothetical protein